MTSSLCVYDYVPNGSLYDCLHDTNNSNAVVPLSWKRRLHICIGVARVLDTLHLFWNQHTYHTPYSEIKQHSFGPEFGAWWQILSFARSPQGIQCQNHQELS